MKPAETRSTIASLLSKYVRELLKRKLSRYLENPDIETQGSLTRPEVTLKRIMLREDALDMYVLPVSVTRQSLVDTIKASFPITAFGKEPVVLELSNIRIFVVPNEANWTDFGRNKEKMKKLEEWMEEQKSEFRDMEKKGMFATLKQKVLNNIKQTIRNMEVVYLDNKSMGYPCFIRIYIGRIQIETVNADWQPEYSSNLKVTNRLITITEFSVALVADKHEVPFDEVTDMHEYYKRVSLSERHYILKPCNITIKHRLSHTDPLEEPWQTIFVESAGIELALSEVQFQYIKHLLNFINFKQSYKKYQGTRPSGSVQDNPKAWWTYLVNAAKHDIQANFKVLYDNKIRMERYIELFKRHQDIIHSPWLQQLKHGEREELRQYEEKLPVNDLLFYRSVALNHLRIEAMQYVRAKGNVKGITHLGDLWDYYLNDFESLLGDPNQQVAREEEVEMNREEQQELKILMSMDKQDALKSLLSGKSSTAQDQTFQITFSIRYVVFYLQQTINKEIGGRDIYQAKQCNCSICTLQPARKFESILARPGALASRLFFLNKSKKVNFDVRKEEDSDEERRRFIIGSTKGKDLDTSVDYMVEVQKITHDNPDPRLLGEYTLLVVNLEFIEGTLGILRNGRKWSISQDRTESGFKVSKLYLWDPISLRDPDTLQSFYKAYKLKNLLDDLIELNVNDDPAFYSLKHFMWRSGLLPCFEFYVHHKEVTPDAKGTLGRNNRRYCSCGHSYTREQLFYLAFLDVNSTGFLHMSAEERPQDMDGMSAVAEHIQKVFGRDILPYFVRRCARWIFPSTLRRLANERKKLVGREGQRFIREHNSSQLSIDFEFLGETNPIEVTFGTPSSRPVLAASDRSHLDISLVSLRCTLSNTTVSALVQWFGSEETETEVFAKESLLATFKERIGRMRPELVMVSEMSKQGQKDIRHLYRYMQDLVKNSPELTSKLIITKLELQLLDEVSIEKYIVPPIVNVRFVNVEIQRRYRVADAVPVENRERPRHAMAKDLKFYCVTDLSIEEITVSCLEKILVSTSVYLVLYQSLVEHHPELPDLVLDAHIPQLALSLTQSTLPLLSFINNLDFKSNSIVTDETTEQWSDAGFERLFDIDLERTRELMIRLNKQHYKGRQPCQHCQLMYTKYRKLLYFSIGKVEKSEGLVVGVVQDGHVVPAITMKIPMLVLSFTERCFLQTASLLVSSVSLEGTTAEAVIVKVSESKRSVFPVIPAKVYYQLPYLREALATRLTYDQDEACKPHEISLQEVLILRQHIHPEVYTERRWNYRESEYLRNKLDKSNVQKPVPGLQHTAPMKAADSDIRYSDVDYLYVKLESVTVNTSEPLHHSQLLAAVVGVQSLLSAGNFLGPKSSDTITLHTRSKLNVIAKLGSLQLACRHKDAELILTLKDLELDKTPHNDLKMQDLRRDQAARPIETLTFAATSIEISAKLTPDMHTGVSSLTGSILNLQGSIETFRDRQDGFFRLSNLVIENRSEEKEVVLLAAPSCIRGDAVKRPEGECVKANYRQGQGETPMLVEIRPVAVLLEAEMIVGLQRFLSRLAAFAKITSPVNPMTLLRPEHLSTSKPASSPIIITAESLQGVLVSQNSPFLTIEFVDIVIEGKGEGYFGSIDNLALNTKLQKYPNIITKTCESALLTFTYLSDCLTLRSPGLSFLFLNRSIEDFLSYLKLVKGKSEEEDKEDKLKLEILFDNAELRLPNASTGDNLLIFLFERLKVENGTQKITVFTPNPFDPNSEIVKKQERDVVLSTETAVYKCDLLCFTGSNAKVRVLFEGNEQMLGNVPVAKVEIQSAPPIPLELKEKWGLDTQVKVTIEKPLLVPSLSDFVHFIDIIEANVDEKSDRLERIVKWENTQFDIAMETGRIVVDKWLLSPSSQFLPNQPLVRPSLDSLSTPSAPFLRPPIMPVMQVDYSDDSDPEAAVCEQEGTGSKELADLLDALG